MKMDEKKARDLYNLQKEIYGQGSIQQMNVEIPAFLEVVQKNGLFTGNILDVGVGTGQLSMKLLETFRNKDAKVYGFDISEENIRAFSALQKRDARIANPVTASFYEIPYEASFFDLAVSNHVLHYAEDINSALKEIRRVLKPGSFFVFSSTVCEESSPGNIIQGVLVHEKLASPIKVWGFQRSKDDILQALNNNGFALMPVDNGSYFKEFWPSYYYYRSEQKNAKGATPHTFVAVAQAVSDKHISQTWDIKFSEDEFKVQVAKIEKLLKSFDYSIEHQSKFLMPLFYRTIPNARGAFNAHQMVLSTGTTFEDKFYFLLNGIAHIAQWKADGTKKEKSFHFQKTLKETKDLGEHYAHKLDSVRYLIDFMFTSGYERYILWYLNYFLVDQKYVSDYVADTKDDVSFEYFQKLLKEKDLLEAPQNIETALLRKTLPDMHVKAEEKKDKDLIYFI